jgi:ubiquinone/menaquinone biosynthesis C-methylase UbiE
MIKPRLYRALEPHLATMQSSQILDIGFGDASHALDWAAQGHEVTAITVDQDEIEKAETKRQSRDLGHGACNFILLDALNIESQFAPSSFDAVVAHNVLHQIEKPQAIAVVESMQHVTRSLGINAVGGYVMNPSELANPISARNMFRHGELARYYTTGWDVQYHREDPRTVTGSHSGKEYVSSHTDIVARKR